MLTVNTFLGIKYRNRINPSYTVEEDYGYAVEKAGQTKGYTFTMFEEV